MTTRISNDIQIRASLIDDYLQVEDQPVAPGLTGRFVALQDPAAPATRSLVTVHPDGSLIQFAPDPASHSGWAVSTVPVTPPANTAAQPNRLAGYVQGATSNLLAYFPVQGAAGSAAVWMQAEAGVGWAQAQLTHDSENALGYTYQTDTYIDAEGNQYLYGLTGNISPAAFFLVAFDPDENAWDVVYEQFVTRFSPALSTEAVFRLMPGTGGNTFNVLWIDQGVLYFQGAQLADDNFSWTTPSPAVLGLGTAGVQQIIAMPGAAGSANLLVIDGSSRLLLVENYTSASPTVVPLSGGSNQPAVVQSASVGVATGGLLMLFAAEKDTNYLWILRQTGTGSGGAPGFAGWVNLGNAVDAVACPPLMQTEAEIYAVNLQQTVYHFSQTADRVWASHKLAAPTPSTATPKNVAATTMHATVLDKQGAPIGGAVVTITSDQPATLIVNNLSYHVGPNAPAIVQADPAGTLTAVLSTISLLTPVLTFTVTNTDGSSASRWCHGDVVETKIDETPIPPCQQSVATRLANQDPTKPINSTTLSNAGLISPNYADPSGAAAAVVASGQWLQQHPQSVGNSFRTDHIKTKHWRIDFAHPSGPQFSVLTEEESRRMVEEARARRAAAAADGQVGDLQGFLGDILNFFKHLWEELESISAHVLDDVLHLLVNGVEFIVQTLREAADALETVFNRIIQGLKDLWQAILDVINFLKQLFEWGDILLTHKVIKGAINSFMTTLVGDIDDLETLVNEQFTNMENQVKGIFQNLVFEPGQTFNQFANTQGGNPAGQTPLAALLGGAGGNALAAGPVNTAFAQHGPRCNYVHSYAKSYYGGAGAGSLPCLSAALGDTQSIIDLVNEKWVGTDLSQQLSNLQTFVTGKISSPQDFFDLVIVDFLIALEDAVLLILNGLEDIALAVLQATGSAISGLQSALNATVDIPVISWLYKYVITGTPTNPGDDLSILDVLSLIFAVPATILYKVMNNDQAPFSNTPEVQQIIANGLPWPPVPTQANIRARVPAPAALRDISPTTITALGLVAGFANFFGTFITITADDMAFTGAPLPGFISWCSVTLAEVSQAMGAPLAVLAKDAHTWTTADRWTVGLWGGSLWPLAYDSVFTIGTGGLARFTDFVGPILDTGNGLALTGIASVAAFYQGKEPSSCTGSSYTGWDQANSVVPQIGRIFKCLILTKDLETALPLLSVLDLVLGIGSTVTQIGDAIHG